MGVDAKHPLYEEFIEDQAQMRDTYRGQRVVKAAGVKYLPPTAGMIQDGMENANQAGFKAYSAYLMRAVFPDLVKQAVEAMLGVMHSAPPTIELPAAMERLREKATLRNESLEMLLRRINEEQLVTGRMGLLAEIVEQVDTKLPFIATYHAESVINWDQGTRQGVELESLNIVVLDESGSERINGEFEWERVTKYRVLVLGDVVENEPQGEGVYRVGVFREDSGRAGTELAPGETLGTTFRDDKLIEPSISGRKLDRIPFVFVNTKDVASEPEEPPLLGLSNLSLTIYRGEADYRQSLFMQGQDTLVVIGHQAAEGEASGPSHRVGANASIDLPIGGDAKFIGVSSDGLGEQRSAIENDHARAGKKAGELIDETSRARESGEALKVRVSARTATLNQIALAGAFGLQELLRMIAVWIGANPEEVIVTPNLDFVDDRMTGQELAQIMAAKGLGAPLSMQEVHRIMQERGMTTLTFEEEIKAIEEEEAIDVLGSDDGSTDQNGPEDDPDEDDDTGDDDA